MPNGRRSPLLGTPFRRYLAAPPALLQQTWGKIQEGLTPWGRALAQQIAPPMELRWRFPQRRWVEGQPPAWGYWSPSAPRGQQVALWSGMPGGESMRGEVGLHELGHAVQSRTWGGTSPASEMALRFYRSLPPWERETYGYPQGDPIEAYARIAQRPARIPQGLQSWYPQYWPGWSGFPAGPAGGGGGGFRGPGQGRLNTMLRQMGW